MLAAKRVGTRKAQARPRIAADRKKFMLRLYVAGTTPRSMRAILDAERLCKEHLGDRFTLEVIDMYQRPALARDEQIVAVPTLVRRLPEPLRKLVGDLSDSERVLIGLDLLIRDERYPCTRNS